MRSLKDLGNIGLCLTTPVHSLSQLSDRHVVPANLGPGISRYDGKTIAAGSTDETWINSEWCFGTAIEALTATLGRYVHLDRVAAAEPPRRQVVVAVESPGNASLVIKHWHMRRTRNWNSRLRHHEHTLPVNACAAPNPDGTTPAPPPPTEWEFAPGSTTQRWLRHS